MSDDLRELDARIAEKVCGWRWVPFLDSRAEAMLTTPEVAAMHRPEFIRQMPADEHHRHYRHDMPRYSTDWTAMGALLDTLREHWEIDMRGSLGGWSVELYCAENDAQIIGDAPTLPAAVALAAGKVVEEGRDG